MASFAGSSFALLQAWSNAFEQHYRKGVSNNLKRHGKTTRIIPTRKQRVLGNSLEYTVKAYANRGTRVSNDPMADSPGAKPGEYVTFTVTFDHTTAANNHFASFEIGFSTTIFDLWKRGDATFKDSADFIRQDVQEGMADIKETFAKYIHLNSNGKLGTIDLTATNAGIKIPDDDRWDSATNAGASAADITALIKLTPSAIARFGDGQRIDLFNVEGDIFEARNARVSYVHPYDETLVIEIMVRHADGDIAGDNTMQDSTTTELLNWDALRESLVTDGDTIDIYLNASKGASPHGTLDRLFDDTASYFGITDRIVEGAEGTATTRERMLMPIRVDASAGGANVPLTADLYRRIGEVVGWQQGGFNETAAMAQVMSKYEYRQVADFVKEEGITMTPALESDVGRKLNKAFGFDGFILHDPSLGSQLLVVDDFAEPGKIDFINRSQWEQVSPIDGGFRMFPGSIAGIWNRGNQTTTGLSHLPGKTYSANGILLATWVCKWPKGQVRLQGLSTT